MKKDEIIAFLQQLVESQKLQLESQKHLLESQNRQIDDLLRQVASLTDEVASLKVLLVQKGEEEENLLILLWRNTGCFCLINGKKTAK